MIGFNLFLRKHLPGERSSQAKFFLPKDPGLLDQSQQGLSDYMMEIVSPYEDYPVVLHRTGDFRFFIEGKIYNRTIPEIENFLLTCLDREKLDTQRIAHELSDYSGEFMIIISYHSILHFFFDQLGRLPVYISETDEHIYIGRSLIWLKQFTKLQPDKLSMAEYLWCGYPLNNKTLFNGIRRIAGGSIVELNLQNHSLHYHPGEPFNFDQRHGGTLKECTDQLTDLFRTACKNISCNAESLPHVALSGGQDSRYVAYAVSEFNKQTSASSFIFPGAEQDVNLAKQVSSSLHIPWTLYEVENDISFQQQLLQMKMGVNYLALGFLLDYFQQLRRDHPRGIILLTGDGGDKMLPYLGERGHVSTLDELTILIANRHTVIPIDQVARITGMEEDRFMQHLSGILEKYPESNLSNKSIHFTIYERGFQSFYEGEDRNRHFFWSTTPYYDIAFFRYAMQIDDTFKKYYRLYHCFAKGLNKPLSSIPDAVGYNIHHPVFRLIKAKHELFRSLSPRSKQIIRRLGIPKKARGHVSQMDIENCITGFRDGRAMNDLIDMDFLQWFLGRATREQYMYIHTLASLSRIL